MFIKFDCLKQQANLEIHTMLFSKLLVMFLCTLLGRQTYSSPCARKDKVQMTLMSLKPRNSESNDDPLPHYECYLGARDEDATITAMRAYRTSNLNLPEPSSAEPISGLSAHYVTLSTMNDGAFGVFNCIARKAGKQDTTIVTIFLRSDSIMWPADRLFTQTVNVGDGGIIIDMTPTTGGDEQTYFWSINGSGIINVRPGDRYESQDYRLIPDPVRDADNGVYECHKYGGRTTVHAMKRLIVRACSLGKWGPPGCSGICDNCYNGGVCDDETGRCICSPGFSGLNCLTACGGNRFGYSCEFECDPRGPDDSCRERLFCLLDPFGCRCNTGFFGLNCDDNCSQGKFGSSCLQSCHCSESDLRCNRYTGVCESGTCANGWSGTNCQIPDVCPVGYYGGECTKKCRCKEDFACDYNTGMCVNGCAPGSVQNNGVCEECADGYFGESCEEECHCEADACDKATGDCVGCCTAQWVEGSMPCQQGLTDSSYDKVNPGQSSSVTCFAEMTASPIFGLSGSPDVSGLIGNRQLGTNLGRSDGSGFSRYSRRSSINSAQPTDEYYCLLLRTDTNDVLAWLNTSFSTYVLPVLSTAPMLVSRNQTSITISWRAWENGTDVGDPPLMRYHSYFRENSGNWVYRSFVPSGDDLKSSFDNLRTDTNYSFSVSAVRELTGGEGPRGPPVTLKTLCDAPSPPLSIQSEVITDTNQLNISWEVPPGDMCSTGISGYTIYYRKEDTGDDDVQSMDVTDGTKTWAIVTILDPGASYEFSVSSKTDIESGRNAFSAAIIVPTPPPTTPPSTTPSATMPPPNMGIVLPIIIAVVVVVLLLVLLVIFIVVRRKRKRSPKPRSDAPSYVNQVMTDVSTHNTPNPYEDTGLSHSKAPDGSQYEVTSPVQPTPAQQPGNGGHYEVTGVAHTPPTPLKPIVNKPQPRTPPKPLLLPTTPALSKKEPVEEFDEQDNERILPDSPMGETVYANVPRAIPVAELAAYYHNNKKVGLIDEFNLLKKNKQHPWTVATKEENKKKNRFKDLYAYDHCRVVLVPLEEDKHSDYYNASHVLDQEGKKTFIGSQAPNSGCINHFWRMIWQQEVSTIIMLSNLIENGKDRCTQYWPGSKGKSRAFGSIMVSWSSTLQFADFEVRVLEILLDSELRRVYQLHYTTWPDMDVPRDPAPLMELIQHSKRIQGNNTKPVVVHCSAGVGRTGTFIALHCLMEVIKKEKRINVFEFVETMRKNRVNMVQKEGQYVFIYRCLMDYYQTRHTEIPTGLLTQFNIDSKRNTLIEEFNLLNSLDEPGGSKMMDDGEASKKNRFQNTGPNDMGKVYLSSQASSGFSHYINATLYRSLRKAHAFITTQHPLPNTVEDFWRLVYDWNCSTIVMLNQLDARDKPAVPYWPEEGSSQYGNMSVSLKDSQNHPEHTLRQFGVAHTTQQKCLSVTQLQLLNWSDGPSFTGLRELQRSVTLSHTSPGPILVQCIDGIGRSSIYVAAQSALIQAEVSDTVDVFSAARQMRQRNSNVIQEEDDYVLCYRVLQDLLQGNSDYQNLQSGAGRR